MQTRTHKQIRNYAIRLARDLKKDPSSSRAAEHDPEVLENLKDMKFDRFMSLIELTTNPNLNDSLVDAPAKKMFFPSKKRADKRFKSTPPADKAADSHAEHDEMEIQTSTVKRKKHRFWTTEENARLVEA